LVASARNEFQTVPKVELHRHLEGSLRLKTLLEVARKHGITIPPSVLRLSRLVQVQDEDNFTFENFLSKFNTLRMFYRSPDVIERVTREAIEDAALDNIRYLELRFTPVALSRAERFPLHDVMDWVCESARNSAQKYGISVRLIASVNRHESIELAEQVVWLSIDRRDKGIVAVDLAGDEANHAATPFLVLFNEARQAGLKVTIHAGEWGGPENVREAIEQFSVDRIGHGVHVLDDAFTTSLARERGTPFEVCLTSNYQTGAVKALAQHPVSMMIAAGLNVTINTDDPSISQITLSSEYRLAVEDLKIPKVVLNERILAAAQAAFLPEVEKKILVETLHKELTESSLTQ
jgi:adenosine deaminase